MQPAGSKTPAAHNQRLVLWAYCNLGSPTSSLCIRDTHAHTHTHTHKDRQHQNGGNKSPNQVWGGWCPGGSGEEDGEEGGRESVGWVNKSDGGDVCPQKQKQGTPGIQRTSIPLFKSLRQLLGSISRTGTACSQGGAKAETLATGRAMALPSTPAPHAQKRNPGLRGERTD